MVEDKVAQNLEAAGFWRRAASRWLVVMNRAEHTDKHREWIRQRRQYCLSQVTPVIQPEKLDITEISKAANIALEAMGIASRDGALFRKYRDRGG